MNKQSKKIDELINTAKQALKDDDVDKAVSTDSVLAQYLKNSNNVIKTQTQIHSNQYDFITKYRVTVVVKEITLLLVSMYIFQHAGQVESTWAELGLYALGGILGWNFLKSMFKTTKPLRLCKFEEDAIVQEKMNIQETYHNMSKITEYQMDTFDKMTEMYDRFEEKQRQQYQNQGLGAFFGNPPEKSKDDSTKSTESEK